MVFLVQQKANHFYLHLISSDCPDKGFRLPGLCHDQLVMSITGAVPHPGYEFF